jgi:flagellar basal body-associated protein FliL
MSSKAKGFALLEVLLIIAVAAIVGLVIWNVFNSRSNEDNNTVGTTQSDEVPAINDSGDLEEAEVFLNEQDIDEQLNARELDEALTE